MCCSHSLDVEKEKLAFLHHEHEPGIPLHRTPVDRIHIHNSTPHLTVWDVHATESQVGGLQTILPTAVGRLCTELVVLDTVIK